MSEPGPLPQWRMSKPGGPYEATAPDGIIWRLWHGGSPAGWRLAPRDNPGSAVFITGDHGLYFALDMAGLGDG